MKFDVGTHRRAVGHFPRAGLFARLAMGAALERFRAKHLASTFQPGAKSPDWLKIKRAGWQDGRTWRN